MAEVARDSSPDDYPDQAHLAYKNKDSETDESPASTVADRKSEERDKSTTAMPVAGAVVRMHPSDDQEEPEPEVEDTGVSLEELSQAYTQLIGQGDPPRQLDEAFEGAVATSGDAGEAAELFDPAEGSLPEEDPLRKDQFAESPAKEDLAESDSCPVTPRSILEAILFVGRPDNKPISAAEIAGLMRGVSEAEIHDLVADLNSIYQQSGHAMRIVEQGVGYVVQLADDLSFIRDRFYGRVREIKLNQASIDCLALVAYRPGMTRDEIDHYRGQPSGSVLNQLVRRQLIEVHREGDKKPLKPHYYPTDKLVRLAGLSSLEDLPQVDEWD